MTADRPHASLNLFLHPRNGGLMGFSRGQEEVCLAWNKYLLSIYHIPFLFYTLRNRAVIKTYKTVTF